MKKDIKKIELLIGEPWDFSSPDGANVLLCRAQDGLDFGVNSFGSYLIVDCTPFVSRRGHSVDSLLLKARYRGENVNKMQSNEAVTVNASFLKDGRKWTHEVAHTEPSELNNLVEGFIIGSASLILE